MNRYATIKDIAIMLNISISTVSRALRNTYDVSQETKEKVKKAAAQIHYKPNYNAIALAKRSTHNIGVILPFITNYYFSTVITGIQEVAYSKGFNIILYVTNDSAERELSIVENLTVSALDGLLVCISSNSGACEHFEEIINNGIPVVFFDRVPAQSKTSKVMQDDFNGAFEAVEHLFSNGYKKIAHITGPKGFLFTESRLQGFLAAHQKYNVEAKEEFIVHSGFSQESGEMDVADLLKCADKPDAIFAVNDRKAIGAMITLKKNGIRIGKEVGVVGFTNDPVSALISPSLSTIAEPAFEIGMECCELLLKHIKKKNFISEEKIIPAKLVVRESSNRNSI